jgi:hypothetical protein
MKNLIDGLLYRIMCRTKHNSNFFIQYLSNACVFTGYIDAISVFFILFISIFKFEYASNLVTAVILIFQLTEYELKSNRIRIKIEFELK